jgi:hypothetical protein
MWKAALAGALALATMGSSLAWADGANETLVPRAPAAQQSGGATFRVASTGHAAMEMADARINRFKTMLRLTVEQERHWPAVEAALRDIIRRHESEEPQSGGVLQRVSERAASAVLSAGAIKRLVAAAQPLIKSLNQEQRRDALQLARNMGFGDVAAKFE